jgi:hypothetical protein
MGALKRILNFDRSSCKPQKNCFLRPAISTKPDFADKPNLKLQLRLLSIALEDAWTSALRATMS